MANNAEGWLLAAAYRTDACPALGSIAGLRFRDLPSRRKRELTALVVAGFASTALVLAPVAAAIADDAALSATSLRLQLGAVPVLSPTAALRIAIPRAYARSARPPLVSNAFRATGPLPSAPVVQLTANAESETGAATPFPSPVPATGTDASAREAVSSAAREAVRN